MDRWNHQEPQAGTLDQVRHPTHHGRTRVGNRQDDRRRSVLRRHVDELAALAEHRDAEQPKVALVLGVVDEADDVHARAAVLLQQPDQLVTGVSGAVDQHLLGVRVRYGSLTQSPEGKSARSHRQQSDRRSEDGDRSRERPGRAEAQEAEGQRRSREGCRHRQPHALLERGNSVATPVEHADRPEGRLSQTGEHRVQDDAAPQHLVELKVIPGADDRHRRQQPARQVPQHTRKAPSGWGSHGRGTPPAGHRPRDTNSPKSPNRAIRSHETERRDECPDQWRDRRYSREPCGVANVIEP